MTPPIKPIPELDFPRGSAGALLQVAASQIGYREGFNNDNAFGVWYPMNHDLWCAMFVSWAAEMAGVGQDVIPKHASTRAGEAWFRARGLVHSTPEPGDIGYVFYPALGRIGHVFIVETVRRRSDGRIELTTVEGNTNDTGSSQGNGVYRLTRIDNSNLSYGRPVFAAASTSMEDEMSAKAEAEITEILAILKSAVAPGQSSFASTIEATLSTSQRAINEIQTVIGEAKSSQRLLMIGTAGSPRRFLLIGGRLAEIPKDTVRADLEDSKATRLVMIDEPTLEWMLEQDANSMTASALAMPTF